MGRPYAAGSVGKTHPLLKVETVTGKRVAQHKVNESDATENLQWRERSFRHLAAGEGQLPKADDGDQRRALNKEDARAHEGRRSKAEHLRVDAIRNMSQRRIPRLRAASHCARGRERIAALKTSAMKAPK